MPEFKNQFRGPEEEKISKVLDGLYPRAKSGTIVDYEGKKYQIKYFPVAKSEDGEKVKEWGHRWMPVRPR